MGSSRDLIDEEVEDANATVISNGGRIPSRSYITPIPYPHGAIGAQGANGDFSFTLDKVKPLPGVLTEDFRTASSEMAVMTPHGQVKINLDTGDLTFPPGIGRDVAVREFWLGFQENFRGAEKTKYENEIAVLKAENVYITQKADEYKNYANDVVKKSILKKITEKYGNEKFIMMKPADLIRMIEEA
jgi:hypothetical protein